MLTGTGEFYGSSALVHWIGRKVYLGGMYVFVTAYLAHPPIFGSNFMMRREVWSELKDEVHRTERNIHDDLDLSLHLRPWMQVEYDPTSSSRSRRGRSRAGPASSAASAG